MEIIKLPIAQIEEYSNNAKELPQEQIDQIINSIKEFGFNDPIAIDEENIIIEGHGRLYALKQMGASEVECIRLSHLSKEQKKAYILAHNKLTMNTGFNLEILESELSNILTLDMSLFGFDINQEEEEIEEDNFIEELSETPVILPGDMIKLGRHTLLCGDSTVEEDVDRLMNGELADLCLTDPPYNVAYTGSNGLTIKNDSMSSSDFYKFMTAFYKNMAKSIKPGAAFYIFHASNESATFIKALEEADLTMRQQLIWVKNSMIIGRQDYQWKHEPIIYGWKDGAAHYFIDNRTQETVIEDKININKLTKDQMKNLLKVVYSDHVETTIIHEDKPTVNDVHPTMKPLKLCGRLIKNSSQKEQLVVDFFGGSGSTMMSAEMTNRRAKLMEYDPKYAQVIIERYIKLVKDDSNVFITRDGKTEPITSILNVEFDKE